LVAFISSNEATLASKLSSPVFVRYFSWANPRNEMNVNNK